MASRKFVTDNEIAEMLDYVALLIDWYGNAFWPIFERLETELENRKSRERRLNARLNSRYLTSITKDKH